MKGIMIMMITCAMKNLDPDSILENIFHLHVGFNLWVNTMKFWCQKYQFLFVQETVVSKSSPKIFKGSVYIRFNLANVMQNFQTLIAKLLDFKRSKHWMII